MTPELTLLRRLVQFPVRLFVRIVQRLPAFRFIRETQATQTPIDFRMWFRQEIMGMNQGPYWPVHPSSQVTGWRNIVAGVETSPGIMPGCYIQGIGTIEIGDYTQIGPGVGIISANHAKNDLREHDPTHVKIGAYSWLGMGCIVLPGVTLGDFTIVAAGSVVTKSFEDGYCVIAGNPARLVRKLDPETCIRHTSDHEYIGFIRKDQFAAFRAKNLNL